MRISDWSSDVCSSDLVQRTGDQPDAAVAGGAAQDLLGVAGQALRVGGVHAEAAQLAQQHHPYPREAPGDLRHFAGDPVEVVARREVELEPGDPESGGRVAVGQGVILRSEEHTSELQSLM